MHSALKKDAPTVRLAHDGKAQGEGSLRGARGVTPIPRESAPALLVSYAYLDMFIKNRSRYVYRDWVMDSGAFTAKASGKDIDITAYIEKCKELLATDPTLTEVFALDVIGDWKASRHNADLMWEAGVPAIPCFHFGSPEEALVSMARDFPKIALGGCVGLHSNVRLSFVGQCFARVWPKKIHGFGFGSEKAVLQFPFHSVDATTWEAGPCRFGRWQAFGRMSVRGSKQNLRAEIEWFLELERKARQRWKKEMAVLDSLDDPSPNLRLALSPSNTDGSDASLALENAPELRLAISGRLEHPSIQLGVSREGAERPSLSAPSVQLGVALARPTQVERFGRKEEE